MNGQLHSQTRRILNDVYLERDRQEVKWGTQHMPDGTSELRVNIANEAKRATDAAAQAGSCTWKHVLVEEVEEAFAETDQAALRTELVQVAAVACAWVADIDSRKT